jgi:hypothetical protein
MCLMIGTAQQGEHHVLVVCCLSPALPYKAKIYLAKVYWLFHCLVQGMDCAFDWQLKPTPLDLGDLPAELDNRQSWWLLIDHV